MGVILPFFVLVSAMGVLISLVAIPLRENARIYSCERLVRTPCFGWKFVSTRDRFRSVYNRLKLLKLQTLRINDDYGDYSTIRGGFGALVKHRIEGVTRRVCRWLF